MRARGLGNTRHLFLQGKRDYITARQASELPGYGIKGVDLSGRPSTDGKRLALSSRHNRTVKLLDVSDITQPKLTREYALFGHPGACSFWNGRLLIPAG